MLSGCTLSHRPHAWMVAPHDKSLRSAPDLGPHSLVCMESLIYLPPPRYGARPVSRVCDRLTYGCFHRLLFMHKPCLSYWYMRTP